MKGDPRTSSRRKNPDLRTHRFLLKEVNEIRFIYKIGEAAFLNVEILFLHRLRLGINNHG
jgi:hypothetical protein